MSDSWRPWWATPGGALVTNLYVPLVAMNLPKKSTTGEHSCEPNAALHKTRSGRSTRRDGHFTATRLVEAIVADMSHEADAVRQETKLRDLLAQHEMGRIDKHRFLVGVRQCADREAIKHAIVALAMASSDASLVRTHMRP